jgi:hypothetical protein
MTARIERGMPAEAYHAAQALSASSAWILSEECPARCWAQSPFNPDRLPDEHAHHFDVGAALHLAVLEPLAFSEGVHLVEADNYRTKQSQAERDEAYAAGKTPLLTEQMGLVRAMHKALINHPEGAAMLADESGDSEVSIFWTDESTGIPCKARPDFVPGEWSVIYDLKTAASANPAVWPARAYRDGHHLRAAWYQEAVQAAKNVWPDYRFVVVEKDPPHVIQVYELDPRALDVGRSLMRRALRLHAECMADPRRWREGYAPGVKVVSLPNFAEFALAEREAAGELE